MHRNVFDPVAQHRDWCPWVSVEREEGNLDGSIFVGCEAELPQPGWKAALTLFLSMKEKPQSSGGQSISGEPNTATLYFAKAIISSL